MTAFSGEVHPFAALWQRPDEEVSVLADSIAENGLRHPIVLTPSGAIADGVGRLRACEMAGVEPRFIVDESLTDDDAVAVFVENQNADRYHIGPGQRAMYRARLLHARGKRRNGRWERGTFANDQNLDRSTEVALSKAGLVLDWCPALAEQVVTGVLSLDAAYQKAKAAEDEATREDREAKQQATLLADLRMHRPDLAALVDEAKLPLDDALDLRRRDAEKQARDDKVRRAALAQQNLDLHTGYSAWSSTRHPDTLAEVQANYEPLAHDITGPMLRSLGEWLIELSDRWRTA